MGYKISYDTGKRQRRRLGKWRFAMLSLFFFALFLIAVYHIAPEGLATFQRILFDASKLDALLQELRQGEDFVQAVGAFCQGILNGT